MKCPNCKNAISCPDGNDACVNGVDIVILVCPDCDTILGTVHSAHSSYFTNCNKTSQPIETTRRIRP